MARRKQDERDDPLFREIEEDVRRENILKLWRRFRGWIIGTAVATVVIVAGGIGIVEYRKAQHEQWGDRLLRSLLASQEESPQAVLNQFIELEKDSDTAYRILSLFNEASTQARLGNTRRTIEIYNQLQSEAQPAHLRDLATVLWGYYQLDGNDDEALRVRLQPLTRDDNPWRFSAREVMAFLAYRRGENEKSRTLFQMIQDDSQAPEGVRTRARQMLRVLGN